MSKARIVIILLLSLIFLTASKASASGEILYGIWSQGWPSGSVSLAEGYAVLADTFKFNVIIGIAPPERIASMQQFGLKAIGQNINGPIDPFPEMYAHMSTYVTFYAEGQPYSGTICRDQGSGTVCINSTWLSPHYRRLKYPNGGLYNPIDSSFIFRVGIETPGRVQKGPYIQQFARYWAGSWRTAVDQESNVGLAHYVATWRFKLGQATSGNDTVATLLVLYGEADEADTLAISHVLTTDPDVRSATTPWIDRQMEYDFRDFSNPLKFGDSGDRGLLDSQVPEGAIPDSLVQFAIDWTGSRNFAIQSITVHDDHGHTLITDPSEAKREIESYYSNYASVGLAPIVKWHLAEEISVLNPSTLLPIRVVDSLCKTMSPSIKSYVLATDTFIAAYVNVDEYDIEPYPFNGDMCRVQGTVIDSNRVATAYSSDEPVGDSLTLQEAWDKAIGEYSRWTNWAKPRNKKVTTAIQSFSGAVYSGSTLFNYKWRNPTASELLCNVNLALCYDVRQIVLWKLAYSDKGFSCEKGVGGSAYSIKIEGLLRDSGGVAVPTENWYSVRDVVSPAISALIPHLEPLEWIDALRIDAPEVDYYVDSVVSAQYPDSATFVELGVFYNPSECAKYIFFVNRRCLSHETTTLSVYFKRNDLVCAPSQTIGFRATDDVTGDRFSVYSNWDGQLSANNCFYPGREPLIPDTARFWFNFSLEPGQGRLIKIEPIMFEPCLCGDADGNGIITITDAVYLITYIFGGGPAPDPPESGDVDCNGIITTSDAVYLITYVFGGGPAPCAACTK